MQVIDGEMAITRAKMRRKKPDASESLVQAARVTIAKALDSLDQCVERVGKMLDKGVDGVGYDDKAASHLAWLTKHVAQILGEVRKLEVHDKNMVARMTAEEKDALVKAYLMDLPPERRAEFRALLDDLEDRVL